MAAGRDLTGEIGGQVMRRPERRKDQDYGWLAAGWESWTHELLITG